MADPRKAAEFLRAWLRDETGLSISRRETERVLERLMAEKEEAGRKEGGGGEATAPGGGGPGGGRRAG